MSADIPYAAAAIWSFLKLPAFKAYSEQVLDHEAADGGKIFRKKGSFLFRKLYQDVYGAVHVTIIREHG